MAAGDTSTDMTITGIILVIILVCVVVWLFRRM
jgi:flagellar biogenesis protein FliO